MVNILIKKDNYAYITSDSIYYFDLIKRSFSRDIRKYNLFWRRYEIQHKKYYTLQKNGEIIKVKAGLIQYLTNSLDKRCIAYNIKSERDFISKYNVNFVYKLNSKVQLRDYQIEAVNAIFNYGYCCIQLATGAGKTECASSLIKTYLTAEKHREIVYVVPTIKLQKESKERFEKYGIETHLGLPFTINKVNIVTYASLIRSEEISKDGYNSVGLLIFDECHKLRANKTSKIVHSFTNLQMCVGLSATIIPDEAKDYKTKLAQIESEEFDILGCTGYLCYHKSIETTIEDKAITPVKVNILKNPEEIILPEDKIADWLLIKERILQSPERANLIAKYVRNLVDNEKLNTVCLLIPEVEWSKKFMQVIADEFKDIEAEIILLYGSNRYDKIVDGERKIIKKEEDKQQIDADIKNPNKITIFSCTSFFYEGVDIPNLQAIVNVYGGRSKTRVKQQVGRVVRTFGGKNIAYVHEIYDKNPVLISQLKSRLNIYKKEYNAELIKSAFELED